MLPLQVLFRLLAENVGHVAAEDHVDLTAHGEVGGIAIGGDDDHHVVTVGGDVQMHGRAHQLADVDLGRDTALAERDMHRAHARGDAAALDACGGELTIRKDDAPETVKARLDTYHRETEPLKAFYAERGKLKTVENQPTISETTAEIKKALGI